MLENNFVCCVFVGVFEYQEVGVAKDLSFRCMIPIQLQN